MKSMRLKNFIVAVLLMAAAAVQAQMPEMPPVPLDDAVRIGMPGEIQGDKKRFHTDFKRRYYSEKNKRITM